MTTDNEQAAVDVLLADDNPHDIELTKRAFENGTVPTNLHVVKDGVKVMQFLRQQVKYSDAPQPDLILLDLEMPGKHGQEVLAEIKSDSEWRRIPVIILTSSDAERDVIESYDGGANAYLTKPVEYQNFLEMVNRIEEFWFDSVILPPE